METLQLLPRQERRILAGHLWIFSNEVDWKKSGRAPVPGEPRLVVSSSGRPLGLADVHPHTLIAARLQPDLPESDPDAGFWRQRLGRAVEERGRWGLDPRWCRLVNADGDRLPGLTVDRYGDHAVIQAQTAAMDRRAPIVAQALLELGLRGVKLAGSGASRRLEGLPDADVWHGEPTALAWVPVGPEIHAGALLGTGQKTGFFLDQTENRKLLAPLAAGRSLLDACSYSGGWGLAAARAGAKSCTFIDSDRKALELVGEGWKRAGLAGEPELVEADVFDGLRDVATTGRKFGVVVLDPPAFAKSRKSVDQALLGYQNLSRLGLELVEPGGMLVTCSCSGLVPEEDFRGAVLRAFRQRRRQARLLRTLGASPDHPVHPAMPETRYLKVLVWAVD
jgi:23S rRNA (cytosine1962-C5)-methyltransferase